MYLTFINKRACDNIIYIYIYIILDISNCAINIYDIKVLKTNKLDHQSLFFHKNANKGISLQLLFYQMLSMMGASAVQLHRHLEEQQKAASEEM